MLFNRDAEARAGKRQRTSSATPALFNEEGAAHSANSVLSPTEDDRTNRNSVGVATEFMTADVMSTMTNQPKDSDCFNISPPVRKFLAAITADNHGAACQNIQETVASDVHRWGEAIKACSSGGEPKFSADSNPTPLKGSLKSASDSSKSDTCEHMIPGEWSLQDPQAEDVQTRSVHAQATHPRFQMSASCDTPPGAAHKAAAVMSADRHGHGPHVPISEHRTLCGATILPQCQRHSAELPLDSGRTGSESAAESGRDPARASLCGSAQPRMCSPPCGSGYAQPPLLPDVGQTLCSLMHRAARPCGAGSERRSPTARISKTEERAPSAAQALLHQNYFGGSGMAGIRAATDGGRAGSLLLAPYPPRLEPVGTEPNLRKSSSPQPKRLFADSDPAGDGIAGAARRQRGERMVAASPAGCVQGASQTRRDSESTADESKARPRAPDAGAASSGWDGCLIKLGIAAEEAEWSKIEDHVLSTCHEFIGICQNTGQFVVIWRNST